jgi:hypothetical protein
MLNFFYLKLSFSDPYDDRRSLNSYIMGNPGNKSMPLAIIELRKKRCLGDLKFS